MKELTIADLASLVIVRNQLKSLVANNLSAVPRSKVKDVNTVIQKFDLLFVDQCLKFGTEPATSETVTESLAGHPGLEEAKKAVETAKVSVDVSTFDDSDVDDNLKMIEKAKEKAAKKKAK